MYIGCPKCFHNGIILIVNCFKIKRKNTDFFENTNPLGKFMRSFDFLGCV